MLALLGLRYPDREKVDLESASDFAQEVTAAGYTTVAEVGADLDAAAAAVLAYEHDHPPYGARGAGFNSVGLARQALSISNLKYAATKYGIKRDEFVEYRKLL